MLETPILLVRPSDPSGVRAILDTATRKPLGYARPGRRPWWGLGPAVLEVHEQEDEPLLFTLRRGWGLTPRHEVRDAEGTPVGLVDGRFLRDGWGRCVAVGEEGPGGRAFRDAGGRLLARVARRPDGVEVGFTEAVAADPFAKMMLLAAALGM
jgi:hypothetical protein